MASNDYHFVTSWHLEATCEEVYDILSDPLDLVRWWPEVYLRVTEAEAGEPSGVGRVIDLHTKGYLPYTLDWSFRVIRLERPHGFALEAWGDFVGQGEWSFRQMGDMVSIVYDWRIRADKPLLRRLSWLLKPVFAANHRWAMARGEEGLKRELVLRRQSLTTTGQAQSAGV